MVFLAFTKGLRIDNDLMLFINGRDAGVALNRAFAGGHLGTFVIGDVTFDFLFSFALPHPWTGNF